MGRANSRISRGNVSSSKLSLAVQYASRAQHLPTRAQLRRWISAALQRDVSITLRIVDESEGRELNKNYRGKDYATNVLTFVYDDATRSTVVTTPEGLKLTTLRNRQGETASITDARGLVTSFDYDKNGALKKTTRAGSVQAEQFFDSAGRLVTSTDANGSATKITYDAASRVSFLSDAANPANTNTYGYDNLDRLTNAVAPGTPYAKTQYYPELVEMLGARHEEAFIHLDSPLTRERWFTDPAYFWYREVFLEMVGGADCDTYNCTEGGILFGPGIRTVRLEEFLGSVEKGS